MLFDKWYYGPLRSPESDLSGGKAPTKKVADEELSDVLDDLDEGDDKEGKDHKGGKQSKAPKYKDEEVESAMSLYRALQDPDLSSEIIETLAKKAGILDRDGDTKVTKREAEKKVGKITTALKNKLGKDYEKFSEMVGPALDDAIDELIAEKFGHQEENTRKNSWESEVEKFMGSFVITPEIEDQMKELMADSPPNTGRKGFDAQRYLRRMYKNACEELEVEEQPKESKKSRKNSGINDIPDFVVRNAPKDRSVSVNEAVELAMKGIRLKY